ncbi:MAG: hypothetical protein [Bacteriophage sp.]|nr:MAG: hypothetical protein [Bacteriophage sp.]
MRVIIAGGRDFSDSDLFDREVSKRLWSKLDEGDVEIVSGCCTGADELGEEFAGYWDIPVKRFPAEWSKHGKSAGPRRNADMAIYAAEDDGMLIAFWDGKSRGTKHMIDTAKRYGINVYTVRY